MKRNTFGMREEGHRKMGIGIGAWKDGKWEDGHGKLGMERGA